MKSILLICGMGIFLLAPFDLHAQSQDAPTIPQTQNNQECEEAVLMNKDITPPELVKRIEPAFPQEARRRSASAIIAEVVVKKDGTVACPKIIRSQYDDLNVWVVDALSKWLWKPAKKKGKPVSSRMTVRLNIESH